MSQQKTDVDVYVVGRAFVRGYYALFDSDRSKLAGLYKGNSKLTIEGKTFEGVGAVMEKLTSLNFQSVSHAVKTVDCQPSGCGILVFVTGDVRLDNDIVKFSQTFHLVTDTQSNNNFWINNDIFRIN